MEGQPGMSLADFPDAIRDEARCRSADCQDVAEFRVAIPEYVPMLPHPGQWGGKHPGRRNLEEEWEGQFCLAHLLRVLSIKANELHFHQPMQVERIARS